MAVALLVIEELRVAKGIIMKVQVPVNAHIQSYKVRSRQICLLATKIEGNFLLIVYVDDIVISGDDSEGIQALETYIRSKF